MARGEEIPPLAGKSSKPVRVAMRPGGCSLQDLVHRYSPMKGTGNDSAG